MQYVSEMKMMVCSLFGCAGSMLADLFGGWDQSLGFLVGAMVADYVTGLVVAGVFHNSPKSQDGRLESKAGWKGLCRKSTTLILVYLACRLDLLLGTDYVRNAVIIGFAANECISIVENAGQMGIPIPAKLQSAIAVLNDRQNTK